VTEINGRSNGFRQRAFARVGSFIVVLGLTAAAPPWADASVPTARLGTNVAVVKDDSSARPFLNVFKQARGWITQCAGDPDCGWTWDTGESEFLDLDADGWVRSLPAPQEPGYSAVGTVLDLSGVAPGSRYVMRYEGSGIIDYRLAAQRIAAESTPGRDVLEINPNVGLVHIQIRATDISGTGDYLRNLQLIPEQYEAAFADSTFNPDLLARLRPFQVLRFADWMKVDGAPSGSWTGRPQVRDAFYTGDDGVPPEQIIALSNEVAAAPWINVPHAADDSYVAALATLVRDQLDPALNIYVEYSADVWSTHGSSYQYIAAQALQTWPGGTESDFVKAMNWYGKRSAEVCALWETVFAADADRVHCVISSQAENSGTGNIALSCPLWTAGAPCASHGIDAIAIAPMFGYYLGHPANASTVRGWTQQADGGLDMLFAELTDGTQIPFGPNFGAIHQTLQWIDAHTCMADAYGIDLMAYSAGQKLKGYWGTEWDQSIVGLFRAANDDPRMTTVYQQYLTAWDDLGGGLLLHQADVAKATRHGTPGALEAPEEITSPKYDALLWYVGEDGMGPADLGTNLAEVNDWSTQLPFTDLFKQSRTWQTQCVMYGPNKDPGCTGRWDTGEAHRLDLDEHGWIKSLPAPQDSPEFTRALTYWKLYPEFPEGRFVVFYDGNGTLEYGLGASKVTADSVPNRDVIEIDATDGMTLTVAATDPNDHLRNIRILPEAVALAEESGTPAPLFNPDFIDRTAPYHVLRYMEWMNTNVASLEKWDDRPKPTDARWTENGVPIEVMLALADEVNADPWFTLPHTADDDFVRNMAQLALQGLSSDRRVGIEHSNEVWNGIFSQNSAATAAAKAAWPTKSLSSDDFTLAMNWHGRRTAEMCAIWKDVFGGQAHRVRCVLGAQMANTYSARQALDCPLWEDGPCSDYGIDTIAIAPYFGGYIGSPTVRSEVLAWTQDADGGLNALFQELTQGGTLSNSPSEPFGDVKGWLTSYRALADTRGLALVAYEGGQHIADISGGLDQALVDLFSDANADTRMGSVYDTYLALWRDIVGPGHLFVHFMDIYAPGRYGAWGSLEHVGQTSSPKYDALMRYLDASATY
jgi:hypothetical protein